MGKGSPVVYGNGTGDTFTFDVYRCAAGSVSFQSEKMEPLCQPLVQNLANGPHTLEIVSAGDGEVHIEALYVFQPPIKDGLPLRRISGDNRMKSPTGFLACSAAMRLALSVFAGWAAVAAEPAKKTSATGATPVLSAASIMCLPDEPFLLFGEGLIDLTIAINETAVSDSGSQTLMQAMSERPARSQSEK